MINTLLGTKQKMTQAFVENTRVPVTIVDVTPNHVTQILTSEKNGYWAIQLAAGSRKIKNTTKPLQGHLKGAISKDKKVAPRFLREVRVSDEPELKVGDNIKVSDVFSVGDTVTVTGNSKGKGFAGGVKRWGFAGGPKTHGQSDRHRAPGSIGQGTSPGRVWKGKKMAGRMGDETVTVKNLKVVLVDDSTNTLHIGGPVPGVPKGLLVIERTSPKNEVKKTDETEKGEASS
jgi:large subunit ribosomal protein L3